MASAVTAIADRIRFAMGWPQPTAFSLRSADDRRRRAPGVRDGARGPGKALYLFDPNQHLIEIRYYES